MKTISNTNLLSLIAALRPIWAILVILACNKYYKLNKMVTV